MLKIAGTFALRARSTSPEIDATTASRRFAPATARHLPFVEQP
jgi:hypothetical protein